MVQEWVLGWLTVGDPDSRIREGGLKMGVAIATNAAPWILYWGAGGVVSRE